MIELKSMFGTSKELVFADFDNRDSVTLNSLRNWHSTNSEPIAVKITSLCTLEWAFLNKYSITMHEDISSCFDGLRDNNWMLKEINQTNILKILNAEKVEVWAQRYEQWYSPEYDEIDFEFGMGNCMNLSQDDCLSIGGDFSFNQSDVNENGRVRGTIDQQEPVSLYFMEEKTKKNANKLLDKRLHSIKDVFIKYGLDMNAFHVITSNMYQ